jgi:hypothetical protein
MKKRFAVFFLAGCIAGIFISFATSRRELWLDLKSGELKEKIYIFPYSHEQVLSDRAFPLLFRASPTTSRKWILADRGSFLLATIGASSYTTGNQLLSHQRTLLRAFTSADFRADDRKEIARIYLEMISNNDYASASEYVTKVWEKTTNP